MINKTVVRYNLQYSVYTLQCHENPNLSFCPHKSVNINVAFINALKINSLKPNHLDQISFIVSSISFEFIRVNLFA